MEENGTLEIRKKAIKVEKRKIEIGEKEVNEIK